MRSDGHRHGPRVRRAQQRRGRVKRKLTPPPRIGSAAVNRIAAIVVERLTNGYGRRVGLGPLERTSAQQAATPPTPKAPTPAPSAAPPSGPEPRLYLSWQGFNFVEYAGRHFAIPHGLGSLDVRGAGFPGNYKGVSVATSFAGLIRALAWRWLRWAYWEGSRHKFHEIR